MEEMRTESSRVVPVEIRQHRRVAMFAILMGLAVVNVIAWLLYR